MKLYRILFLLVSYLLIFRFSFSQTNWDCITNSGTTVPLTGDPDDPLDKLVPCTNDYMDFLPDSVLTPVKYVKVNLHIVDTLGGGLNFSGTPLELEWLANAFRFADTIYRQLKVPVIPIGGGLNDSRVGIMFDVNTDVYYHYDKDLCHFDVGTSALVRKLGVLPYQELNIFLTHDYSHKTGGEAIGPPHYPDGITGSPDIFLGVSLKNMYSNYMAGAGYRIWGIYLAHEIGHSLGLPHTFGGDGICCSSGDTFSDTPPEFDGINSPLYIPGTLGIPCVDSLNQGECVNHSNNLMSYNWPDTGNTEIVGRHLSHQQVAMMHALLTVHPQVHHLARMADCSYNPSASITISGNVLWNENKDVTGDVIIPAGSRLTIQPCAMISMASDARVIVQVGGELVVDGGILTSLCGTLWKGVEVWGDPTQVQNSTTPLKQGRVTIKNNGRVEFARTAISTSRRDTDGFCIWPQTGGGIVILNGAQLLYNRRAVEMMAYENGSAPFISNNLSMFLNSLFFNMLPLKNDGPGKAANSSQVTLWGVRGVRIEDCTFALANQELFKSKGTAAYYVGLQGRGILSVDANYTVKSCLFTKLSKGIEFNSNSAGRQLILRESTFNNVTYGAKVVGGATHKVFSNIFSFRKLGTPEDYSPFYFATVFSNTSRYDYLLNNISVNAGDAMVYQTPPIWGVIAHNSSFAGGRIRDNIFFKTNFAIQTEQNNISLYITCNLMTKCGIGLVINPYSASALYPNTFKCASAIALPDLANKFNLMTCPTSYFEYPHIYKGFDPFNVLDYRVAAGPGYTTSLPPNPLCSGPDVNISPCGSMIDPLCAVPLPPIDSSGGGGSGDPYLGSTLLQDRLATCRADIVALQNQYDGGIRTQLLNDIQNNNLPSSQLCTELLAKGPLSDEVIASLLEHSYRLSSTQLIQVMTANTPLSYANLVMLNPLEQQFPAALWTQFQAAQEDRTTNTALMRGTLGYLGGAIAADETELLGHWLADATLAGADSALQYLRTYHTDPGNREALVSLYIDMGLTKSADSLLALLPRGSVDEEWLQLQNFHLHLKQQGRSIFRLQQSELDWLKRTAQGTGTQQQYCAAILDLVEEQPSWFEPEKIPDQIPSHPRKAIKREPELKVFPNPASDRVTVELPTPASEGDMLVITNIQGVILIKEPLSPNQHQAEISTLNIGNGMYICLISQSDGNIYSTKFTIVN